MRRIFISVFLMIAIGFGYGLILSQLDFSILPEELETPTPSGYYDYSGIAHIHRLRNDRQLLDTMVTVAKSSGIDFLLFSDVDDFDKSPSYEGYVENVLVLGAKEYSYLDYRILHLDAAPSLVPVGIGQAQILISDLLSQNKRSPETGSLILLHPFKSGSEWAGAPPAGLDGVEVVNLKTIWEESWLSSKWSSAWSVLLYFFNPRLSFMRLIGRFSDAIAFWDQATTRRSVSAFSGLEVNPDISLFHFPLQFPGYEGLFSIARNHVLLESELTGNFESDRRKVVSALRQGQFYLGFDILASPKGFLSYVSTEAGIRYPMGSRLLSSEKPTLYVSLPKKPSVPFEIVIIRDGKKVLSSNSVMTEMALYNPGVYRVIVRVKPRQPFPVKEKWLTWIITNPFYLN